LDAVDYFKRAGLATRCGLGTIRAPAGRRQRLALRKVLGNGATGAWLAGSEKYRQAISCSFGTPSRSLLKVSKDWGWSSHYFGSPGQYHETASQCFAKHSKYRGAFGQSFVVSGQSFVVPGQSFVAPGQSFVAPNPCFVALNDYCVGSTKCSFALKKCFVASTECFFKTKEYFVALKKL
jgi:hypothetical protein